MSPNQPIVLIRGGGDLATGIAARLHRVGISIVITEIEKPRAVRRLVSLSEAVYIQRAQVEDLRGELVENIDDLFSVLKANAIPVVIDPDAKIRQELQILALVDARMRKRPPELGKEVAEMVVGVGPGFTAGADCHAVIETKRGHAMGRVYWEGAAAPDTGIPGSVSGHAVDRVLRAPAPGNLIGKIPLASSVQTGEVIATVNDIPLKAPFDGVLRGLIHNSVEVKLGEKVGDLDPRANPSYCFQISDKSLAVGGGVLEAILSQPRIRQKLWS